METNPAGQQIIYNVYNNANKVFNLYKNLPLGGVTWGLGAIGRASISTLIKDVRRRFVEGTPEWRIDPNDYTIEDVAKKVRRFLYEENYQPLYSNLPQKPTLGFLVAGYSSGQALPESWKVLIAPDGCDEPEVIQKRDEDTGVYADGQPEAIARLILGYGTALPTALGTAGADEAWIRSAMEIIQSQLSVQFVVPGNADSGYYRRGGVFRVLDDHVLTVHARSANRGRTDRDCRNHEARRIQVGQTEVLL